jgi:hypothetical protein
MNFLCLFAFEVLVSEGHFKEVKAKELHKEEQAEQAGEDSSNV